MDFPYENHSARVAARNPSGLLCRTEAKSGRGWAGASRIPLRSEVVWLSLVFAQSPIRGVLPFFLKMGYNML